MFPDPALKDTATCYQGSDFKGYKNDQYSVSTFFTTKKCIFTDLISVDDRLGISLNIA